MRDRERDTHTEKRRYKQRETREPDARRQTEAERERRPSVDGVRVLHIRQNDSCSDGDVVVDQVADDAVVPACTQSSTTEKHTTSQTNVKTDANTDSTKGRTTKTADQSAYIATTPVQGFG